MATSTVVALAVVGSGAATAAPAMQHQPQVSSVQLADLRSHYEAFAAAITKGDLTTVKTMTTSVTADLPSSMARSAAMTRARSYADQLPTGMLPTGMPGPGLTGTVTAVCHLLFGIVAAVVSVVEGLLGPLPVPSVPEVCDSVSVPPVPPVPPVSPPVPPVPPVSPPTSTLPTPLPTPPPSS